jgi:hypothetical protein
VSTHAAERLTDRNANTRLEALSDGVFAIAMTLVLYSVLAILAIWLPVPVAIITTATWIVWLVMSLRAKHA